MTELFAEKYKVRAERKNFRLLRKTDPQIEKELERLFGGPESNTRFQEFTVLASNPDHACLRFGNIMKGWRIIWIKHVGSNSG